MKAFFLLATVTNLFLVGSVITLRSGLVDAPRRRGFRRLAVNFWGLLVRLLGYLVGLLVVQRAVGLPSPLKW